MKNLLDWIVERTPQYKHLKGLYEQAVKDYDFYFDAYNQIVEVKNKIAEDNHKLRLQLPLLVNKEKQLRKIRTHVNKLDKKDENVKEIKKLIKEVL